MPFGMGWGPQARLTIPAKEFGKANQGHEAKRRKRRAQRLARRITRRHRKH
jgi:hypothetical protein